MTRSVYNARPGSICMFGGLKVVGDPNAIRCDQPAMVGFVMHEVKVEMCQGHLHVATTGMDDIDAVCRASAKGRDLDRE